MNVKEDTPVYNIEEGDYRKYIEINGIKHSRCAQALAVKDLNAKYFIVYKDDEFYIDFCIYKKDNWSRLRQKAGVIQDFDKLNEKQIYSAINKKWLSTNSTSYFNFILKIARKDFKIEIKDYSENELKMLLMLHYDVWQSASGFNSLEESINQIGENKVLVEEIIEVLEILQKYQLFNISLITDTKK